MTIKFEKQSYFPALRTRPAEMEGYAQLRDNVKDKLIPIITLGAWPRAEGIEQSLEQAQAAVSNRPFILDLTQEGAYQRPAILELLKSDGDFAAWRKLIASTSNVVPVVQTPAHVKLSQIIKQARALEGVGTQRIAFRITDFGSDTPRVIAALSALDRPSEALVIIDAGYIRDSMSASLSACVSSINDVRAEIPESIITVISTSFPATVTSHLAQESSGTRGTLAILERELHYAIGADAAIYGDHGSIHSKVYLTTGGRFMPRIDYPLSDAWEFERRPGKDSAGYIDAAKTLVERFPSIAEEDTWGAEKIRNAAGGDIDKMRTPARWIAARVNMHITRQYDLSNELSVLDEADLDDDFEEA